MKTIRQVFYDTNLSLLPYDNVKGLCKEIGDFKNCCLSENSELRKFERALKVEGYPAEHCMSLAISEVHDIVVESYLWQNS